MMQSLIASTSSESGSLGRIKKGHELIADTVSYGNTKGIEIACDIVPHSSNPSGLPGNGAGDLDGSTLQALLQHLHHILILRLQIQHPCIYPLFQGNDLQLPEISPLAQTVEHIILKFRDQRRCRFAIQFLKEPSLIPGGTEDVAPAGLQLPSAPYLRGLYPRLLRTSLSGHPSARYPQSSGLPRRRSHRG